MRERDRRERVLYYDPPAETCSREVIAHIQLQKLKAILPRVFVCNRFYRRKWRAAGLESPAEVRTLDDFNRLPFTTKTEIAEDQAHNPPFGTNLTVPPEDFVALHETSGTTGTPIKWLDTAESWAWWIRCWGFVYLGAGVRAGDRAFFPFSFGPFIGFWSAFEATRAIGVLPVPGAGKDPLARLQAIFDNRVTVLVTTPSQALRLARLASESGIMNLPDCSVSRVIVAGEPGGSVPAVKQAVEELWGARCFDHTGLTEVGATGFECIARPGGVHLIESELIFQVVDPRTGEEVPEGQEGELVATSLGRVGMPAFRYRTGDRVRLVTAPCGCGRTLARLEGGILGRVDDMLIVNGQKLYPTAVENVVRGFPQVGEFLVEVAEGPAGWLRVSVEVDPAAVSPETAAMVERGIAAELRERLEVRAEVVIVPPRSLPEQGPKANRYVRLGGV